MIDGSPIVAIVTGIKRPTSNRKTGPLAQLWILPQEVNPVEALKTGADAGICGACPHRGIKGKQRGCYVNVGQAPLAAWKSWDAGNKPRVEPESVQPTKNVRGIRLGAYGDPAALPVEVLEALVSGYEYHTGYTHQWQRFPELASLVMASVETAAQAKVAHSDGWRTFSTDSSAPDSIECPSDSRGTQCADCRLCGGASEARSIFITPHGTGSAFV